MMTFLCIRKNEERTETWKGTITSFKRHASHYEIRIESRSGIMVVFEKTSCGAFACMPDFGVGCHLADFKDKFWNTEQLTAVLGEVDGITVATALHALADEITF